MGLSLITDNYPIHAQFIMQLVEAVKGNGVYVGLAVTAQGTPDDTVAVSSGRFASGGTILNSAGSASLSFGAADATNPRIDLVEATTSLGAPYLQVKAGTASANPVAPTPDANSVALAWVYIRPTGAAPDIKDADDTINAYIIDGRCYCPVKMGSATLSSGSSVTVNDAGVTAASKVFITPSSASKVNPSVSLTLTGTSGTLVAYSAGSLGNTSLGGSVVSGGWTTSGPYWFVDNLVAGTSFRINTSVAVSASMTFDYMIVG